MLIAEEFGTAVAISVVLSLGELITDVALDRFIMIYNSDVALSTAHLLAIVRSILIGVLLILASPTLAALFGVEAAWPSFALAGGITAVKGFAHLRIKQIQRDYKYGPQTVAVVAANLLAVAAIPPAALLFRDHRAIVVSYFLEFNAYVLLSHLLAGSSYKIRPDWGIARDALVFGLPLTVNGAGLAVIYQLDRTLVGYWFGVKELAYYAVILSVSVTPINLVLASFSNFGMSYLLRGEDEAARELRYEHLLKFYAATSTLYTFGLALALDIITLIVFGKAFTPPPSIHILFAIVALLRLQRGGAPTTLLLATGQTKSLATANFCSVVGLVCAWFLIGVAPRLESVLIGLAIGELISFVVMFALADNFLKERNRLLSHLSAALMAPATIVALLFFFPSLDLSNRGLVFAGGALIGIAQMLFLRAGLQNEWGIAKVQA